MLLGFLMRTESVRVVLKRLAPSVPDSVVREPAQAPVSIATKVDHPRRHATTHCKQVNSRRDILFVRSVSNLVIQSVAL